MVYQEQRGIQYVYEHTYQQYLFEYADRGFDEIGEPDAIVSQCLGVDCNGAATLSRILYFIKRKCFYKMSLHTPGDFGILATTQFAIVFVDDGRDFEWISYFVFQCISTVFGTVSQGIGNR